MRAVVLAGGKGKRLTPYTTVFPKSLMPICGTPILEIVLLQLRAYGFEDITLCTGYLARLIETYFGDGHRLGVNVSYSLEDQPLGTAGPLSLVPPCDEPILVMNADVLSTLDYGDMYQYHCEHGAALSVGLYRKHVKVDLGVLKTDGDNEVIEYIEKPEFEYQVSMGIYIVDPLVHRGIRRNEPLDFPDLVTHLIESGQSVVGYPFEGYWIDIGRAEDYEEACKEFQQYYTLFLPEGSGMLPAFRAAFPRPAREPVPTDVTVPSSQGLVQRPALNS
jgi:NDP-sugar pyrophosphorylase family protein